MVRKGLQVILSFLMAWVMIFFAVPNQIIEVQAATTGCGTQYEVVRINDNGSFHQLGCYNNFASAKAVMQSSGDDAVVRHHASASPTGIIAMNWGLVISYPKRMRSGSEVASVVNIYSNIDFAGKSSYVVQHREMTGGITETYDGNGNGKIYVRLNGFSGYTNLKQVDLVPMKFVTNGIPITLGGNDLSARNEQPFSVVIRQSYYRVEQKGNYKDLIYYAFSGYDGSSVLSVSVGKAADWMSVGTTYYSWDNYNFYHDRRFTSLAGTYYNYYQFLPVRSQSSIPASVYNQFLSSKGFNSKPISNNFNSLSSKETQLWNEGETYINAQNTYGINALMVFSLACLESGYGRSRYAIERNNLFGWNAVDSNPDAASYFSNVSQAIIEHMGINLRGYTDITDARFFGSHVGNKGSGFNVKYASDPYWGAKIAAIAYEIDKFASGNNGNLTDYDKYALGLITEYNASVKKEANGSSATLYTTTYGNSYQSNFIAVVLNADNNWTQIQTTNGVRSDGSLVTHRSNGQSTGGTINGLIPYDFNLSKGYLPTSQIKMLNVTPTTPMPPDGKTPTGEFVFEITELNWENDLLQIKGTAYMPGIHATPATVKHTLVLINSKEIQTRIPLTTSIHNQDQAIFESNEIDILTLEKENYTMKIETEYVDFQDYSSLRDFTLTSYPAKLENTSAIVEIAQRESSTVMTITAKKIILDPSLRISVEEFKWDDDVLFIKGIGLLSATDHSDKTKLKHQVILVNMDTDEKIALDAETYEGDYLVDLYDGFDYTYSWFQLTIDPTTIPMGNYTMQLKLKNEDTEVSMNLYNTSLDKIPATKTLEEVNYKIIQNQIYRYRYELIIEKNNLDFSQVIANPTRRFSMFDYDSLSLTNGILSIKGMGLIYNVHFGNAQNPIYTLYLVDETGISKEYPLVTKSCAIDYTTLLSSSYDLKNICFEKEINLADLTSGTYRMYLGIKTNQYHDIFEMTDRFNRKVNPSTVAGRVFKIDISTIRSRLQLTITS